MSQQLLCLALLNTENIKQILCIATVHLNRRKKPEIPVILNLTWITYSQLNLFCVCYIIWHSIFSTHLLTLLLKESWCVQLNSSESFHRSQYQDSLKRHQSMYAVLYNWAVFKVRIQVRQKKTRTLIIFFFFVSFGSDH